MAHQADIDWEDFKLRHEAAVGYAQSTLKTLTLANGGAIISLLTFIGNQNANVESVAIFWSFVWFSIGLSLTILAHGFAYLVQEAYLNSASLRGGEPEGVSSNRADIRGGFFIRCAAAACLGGLAFFVAGAFVALDAIS